MRERYQITERLDHGGMAEVFRGVAESLLTSPRLQSVLFGSGVFGNQPLRELVAQYIDQTPLGKTE